MSISVKVVGIVKKLGPAAKFATRFLLNAYLPGSPAVIDLAGALIDCAVETAKGVYDYDNTRQPAASDKDLKQLEQIFDLMDTQMPHLMAQLARLETLPDVAAQVLEAALATDARCQDAARRLEELARRTDRQEQYLNKILAGQDDMRPLLQRTAGVADFVAEQRAAGFSLDVFATMLRDFQEGLRHFAQGRVDDAEKVFKRQADRLQDSVTVRVTLAAAQTAGNRFLDADSTLTQAVRLKPHDADLADLHRRVTARSRRTGGGATGAPPAKTIQPGDVLDGWLMEKMLGRGGWGMVMRATKGPRTAAIKVMHAELSRDPTFVDRFKKELMTLMRLDTHPNVITVSDFGYAGDMGCWYFVMPWIDGPTLEQYLRTNGPLPPDAAKEMFLSLADGLGQAHSKDIIHRDIKPDNILLANPDTPGGKPRPILVDFGLAALAGVPGYTQAAGYTALFAPPEQIRKGVADKRSDVFSLAATLYYALLFADEEHREPHLFRPKYVPEMYREVLFRSLDNDPTERPADAGAFRKLLSAGGVRPVAPPPPPPVFPDSPPPRPTPPRPGPTRAPSVDEYIVCPKGTGQYRTIGEALRAAPANARILVRPGRYTEGIKIERPVEIIGDGPREAIVVEPTDTDCVYMDTDRATVRGLTLRQRSGSKSRNFFAVDIPKGQLLLEDCDITSDSLACVGIHGTTADPLIRNCLIRDGKQSGIFAYDGAGGLIEDCEVTANTLAGVEIKSGATTTLRNCQIHDGKGSGVFINENGYATLEGCDIYSNTLAGIEIKKGGRPTLRECKLHDGKASGAFFNEDGSGTLERCEIYANALAGIEAKKNSTPTLTDCIVYDGKGSGLFIWDGASGLVENCDIFNNTLSGIQVKMGANPLVRGCRIHDGKQGGVYVFEKGLGRFEDCDIYANTLAGVEIAEGSNPTMRSCKVHDGKGSGVFIRGEAMGRIENCEIWGNTLAGVEVKETSNPVFRNCSIRDGKGTGVFVWSAGMATFEGCQIVGNQKAGIEIREGGRPTVRNCKINRNTYEAIWIHNKATATVENCDLTGNVRGAWDVEAGSTVTKRGNRE
jgi:F-box protein 11